MLDKKDLKYTKLLSEISGHKRFIPMIQVQIFRIFLNSTKKRKRARMNFLF